MATMFVFRDAKCLGRPENCRFMRCGAIAKVIQKVRINLESFQGLALNST